MALFAKKAIGLIILAFVSPEGAYAVKTRTKDVTTQQAASTTAEESAADTDMMIQEDASSGGILDSTALMTSGNFMMRNAFLHKKQ